MPRDHPSFVYALTTKMVVYTELKQFRAAEDMIPDLLERCLSGFAPSHPERVTVLNNAAAVYSSDGKHEEAERLLHDCVVTARQSFPAGHPTLVAVLRNYAEVLRRLNRSDEAALFREESNVISASALAKTDHWYEALPQDNRSR